MKNLTLNQIFANKIKKKQMTITGMNLLKYKSARQESGLF